MTRGECVPPAALIIPYQELLGNYDTDNQYEL